MAGPLSGIGGQTQIPQAAQTQNTNQNNQGVRQQQEEQRQNVNDVQPQGAPVNSAQQSNLNAQDLNEVGKESFLPVNENEVDLNNASPRGSIIDIAV